MTMKLYQSNIINISLAGHKYIRFEDIVWIKQRASLEVHKVKRWKAKLNIDSIFGLNTDSKYD